MADKLMYIHNDDTQIYPFGRLKVETFDTQQNETTNQNSIEVSKVVKQMNKKTLYDFGDQCNKQRILDKVASDKVASDKVASDEVASGQSSFRTKESSLHC